MRSRFAPLLGLPAAILLMLAACGGERGATDPTPIDPTPVVASVQVALAQTQLTVGQELTATATVRDSRGNVLEGRVISWASTDDAVITVTQSGVLKAVGEGTASVRASHGGKEASASVTVVRAPVASVDLSVASATLQEGDELQITATPRDAGGLPLTGRGIQWLSSNAEIAHVGALGLVTAIRPGTATITVRVEGKTATADVKVEANYSFDLVYSMTDPQARPELFKVSLAQPNAAERLFPPQRWASQAAPSPDGRLIAYVCPNPVDERPAVCVANRDGSASEVVASAPGEHFDSPTWSPDGSRIAYVRRWHDGESARAEIWTVDDEGTRVSLTGGMAGNQIMPAWSPALSGGGSRIAFVQDANRNLNNLRVWTMRADGTDRRQLTTMVGAEDITPAWSPDGQTIAFQRTAGAIFGDIWLVNADGGNERSLLPVALAGWQSSPSWSPDGRLIAFTSPHETYGSGNVEYQVYTVWANGSKLARRTFDAGSKGSAVWLPR